MFKSVDHKFLVLEVLNDAILVEKDAVIVGSVEGMKESHPWLL